MNNLATILITITLLTGGTETVYFDVPVHEVVQQKELNVEYQIAEKDINMLAKTIWNEARGIKSDMEKAAIAWCILNRVDSTDWEFRNMNTIEEVLTAPGQIEGYKEDNPLDNHLVELAEPMHYSERYRRWSMADLPMLPETLDQVVIEQSKEQFEVIDALLARKDVESVVIATDAGREGELVARWILKMAGFEGKAERLWISSQLPSSPALSI